MLVKCHAGCELESILSALGLKSGDLFAETEKPSHRREVAHYDYRDQSGAVRYQVVRFEPKDFRQRRPDGAGGWIWNLKDTERLVYRLPELRGQSVVVVVEGEKDCDRLWSVGIPSTTNVGGAGKWRDAYTQQLAAAGVGTLIVIPDEDDAGRAHAASVAKAWAPRASRIVTLPVSQKGDVSDYLAAHSVEELQALLAEPREPVKWLDVDAQWAAMEAEDAEATTGRRIFLGLPQIDERVRGVRRGEVLGLMGRPGIGKTLLLTHVTQGVGEMDGVGHVFFSLEMPAAQIVARLQQRVFGVNRYQREYAARSGQLKQDVYRRAFASLIVVDDPGLSVAQMSERLDQILAGPFKGQSLGLVTIDHLGLIGGDRAVATYDRVSMHAREIKELAKRYHCAVMLAVQVNRDAGGDGSRELGLGSARDSGVVEEAMDYIIGIRRLDRSLDRSSSERERFENVLFVKVIKHRHGEPDTRETAYRFNATGLQLTEDLSVNADGEDAVRRIANAGWRKR